MPLINVWNYDRSTDMPGYDGISGSFEYELAYACGHVKELGIKNGADVLVAFQGPAVAVSPHTELPTPMLIIVDLLYDKPERTLKVKKALAKAIGKCAQRRARGGQSVEVFIRTFDPKTEASWYSSG